MRAGPESPLDLSSMYMMRLCMASPGPAACRSGHERRNASERALEVVESGEPAGGVDRDADRIEAQVAPAGAVPDLSEVGEAHPADLELLARVECVPRVAATAAGLDLHEDERV